MSKQGDWYVFSMDDGVLRRDQTRNECLSWAMRREGCDRLPPRAGRRSEDGVYEYRVGRRVYWIARGDVAAGSGLDLDQEPLFPYPDEPFKQGSREAAPNLRRLQDY
ncbi:hypothetical protein [Microbispora sp. NPDC049125]|uniref:hypothetical protein n=1 Tax=Microbispora sp. NPDC049125 TaxID=3154929 RepID=UPI003467D98B